MNKLEKTLKQWVSLGLLDQKQADQIFLYESTKPDGSWILSGLLILGVIIIGIGIISVVAANWQQIPNIIKLITDFALLLILSIFIVRAATLQKEILFEILLLGFLILCLASIGLISQIYNTGGEFYQALMLWSVITFPASTLARYMVVPFLWTFACLVALVFTVLNSAWLHPIFQYNFFAIFMAIPLLLATLAMLSKHFVLINGFTRSFQIWFFITGLIALACAEIGSAITYTFMPYSAGYILAIFTAIGILQNAENNKLQKIILLANLVIYLIAFALPIIHIQHDAIYAIFTIIILSLMGIYIASLHKRRLFQWFLILIGLRFLLLYFQALGGLALTGLGLIISGILIITMAVLWNKYRSAMTTRVERWLQ